MMNDYEYMSSGDWFGIALILMMWTVAVVIATAWVMTGRHTHRDPD